ncbi:hypothetical protein ACFXAE_10670 [Streptomyces sp. NPDC059454]|uniref:hypothetical protein n=1 Tax=Streptomyces sp. NPDC059454 TaxID=3346836 RepID=UPI0036BDA332
MTITPTKPLTPTHVKGFLWTDVLVRTSAFVTGVRLVWNNRMATVTTRSTAFWRYLDLTEPDTDWSREPEARIGQRYVAFHSEPRETDRRVLEGYLARADDGWIHPAARRMLDRRRSELELLGVRTCRAACTSSSRPTRIQERPGKPGGEAVVRVRAGRHRPRDGRWKDRSPRSRAHPGREEGLRQADAQPRFPRDAEGGDRGSDGSHERSIDHGCTQKVLAGVA